MFVQRLLRWLTTRVTRPARRATPARAPELALSACAAGRDVRYKPSSGMATARWLDDAQRLHPRRAHSSPGDVGALPSPPAKRLASGDGRRAQDSSSRPRPTPPVTERTAQPTSQLAPASTTPAPSPDRPADPDVRQLLTLRHLVRLGIYNEGFPLNAPPEQYRRSLGASDADDPLLQ